MVWLVLGSFFVFVLFLILFCLFVKWPQSIWERLSTLSQWGEGGGGGSSCKQNKKEGAGGGGGGGRENVGFSSAGPWRKDIKGVGCRCLWWELVPFFFNGSWSHAALWLLELLVVASTLTIWERLYIYFAGKCFSVDQAVLYLPQHGELRLTSRLLRHVLKTKTTATTTTNNNNPAKDAICNAAVIVRGIAVPVWTLTPSLPRCRLTTTRKSAEFETLNPFCFVFCTGMRKACHKNAKRWK